MAEESGESPEVARHIELLGKIHDVANAVTVTNGLLAVLGEKFDNHADDDRRNFDSQSMATKALRTTLSDHIARSDTKGAGKWKAITAALGTVGLAITGWFKWLGPSS